MDKAIKIGLLREYKTPPEQRVALLPHQCERLLGKYQNLEIAVQPYQHRVEKDEAYKEAGCVVQEDLGDCDYLFGIKETPIDSLIDGKHYFCFSHTAKFQEYNKELLKSFIDKDITLTDYEYLCNEAGQRVIAFGRFAGIVGAYNGLLALLTKRKIPHKLQRAHELPNLKTLFAAVEDFHFPEDIGVLITGSGSVAKGAVELMNHAGFEEQSLEELAVSSTKPLVNRFAMLKSEHIFEHKEGKAFDTQYFYGHPAEYKSVLDKYLHLADLFVSAGYWNQEGPRLFEIDQIESSETFKPSVIADISCDIEGGVPTTVRASTIQEPNYDISRQSKKELPAFTDAQETITVMAVDNLPCELPYDASESFGEQLMEHVLPRLLGDVKDTSMIEQGSIVKNGKLTSGFSYLEDYLKA